MPDDSQPSAVLPPPVSGEAPAPKKRMNLRTPEIMKLVQEQVESHYRSPVVEYSVPYSLILFAPGILVDSDWSTDNHDE